jgi:hypothetical protein
MIAAAATKNIASRRADVFIRRHPAATTRRRIRAATALPAAREGLVKSGMSGSSLLSTNGKAMALMSTDGFCPVLTDWLPVWFFK